MFYQGYTDFLAKDTLTLERSCKNPGITCDFNPCPKVVMRSTGICYVMLPLSLKTVSDTRCQNEGAWGAVASTPSTPFDGTLYFEHATRPFLVVKIGSRYPELCKIRDSAIIFRTCFIRVNIDFLAKDTRLHPLLHPFICFIIPCLRAKALPQSDPWYRFSPLCTPRICLLRCWLCPNPLPHTGQT